MSGMLLLSGDAGCEIALGAEGDEDRRLQPAGSAEV